MNGELERLTVNDKSFAVIRLLGKGKGGYSYLVTDGERELVVKQIHHEPCDYYRFGNKLESELRDYERLKAVGIPMPQLLDTDAAEERILKEYIPGETAAEIIKRGGMCEEYIDQVRKMCRLLYAANINIDYFPTNFVLNDGRLYYIDYECNDYMEEWNFERWGIKHWTYRTEKNGSEQ